MIFIIPGRLDGLNEYTNECRRNPYSGANMKKRNEKTIMSSIVAHRLTPVTEAVYLRFNWIEPNKRRDKDNIASAKKFIIDALVKSGILENDGWKNVIGFSDRFSVDKNNPRIEVEILTEEEMNERQNEFIKKVSQTQP